MVRKLLISLIAFLFSAGLVQAREEVGTLIKVDQESKMVVVKIGSRYQSIFTGKVSLYDQKGNRVKEVPKAWVNAKVRITFTKDGKKTRVSKIRLAKKSKH
jgi:hypothetical protein